MKKNLILLFLVQFIFICLISAEEIKHSFGIYLIKKDNSDLKKIELFDNPIITSSDIIKYDWNKHEIELTEAGFKKLPNSKDVGTGGKHFVVVADGIICYRGAFWTSISSISYSNPIINVSQITPKSKNTVLIERAYPSASFAKGDDPRNNKHIYNSLYNLGKISM